MYVCMCVCKDNISTFFPPAARTINIRVGLENWEFYGRFWNGGKKKIFKKGRRKEKKVIKTEGSKTSVVYISFPIFQKERKARNVVEREKEKRWERYIAERKTRVIRVLEEQRWRQLDVGVRTEKKQILLSFFNDYFSCNISDNRNINQNKVVMYISRVPPL